MEQVLTEMTDRRREEKFTFILVLEFYDRGEEVINKGRGLGMCPSVLGHSKSCFSIYQSTSVIYLSLCSIRRESKLYEIRLFSLKWSWRISKQIYICILKIIMNDEAYTPVITLCKTDTKGGRSHLGLTWQRSLLQRQTWLELGIQVNCYLFLTLTPGS